MERANSTAAMAKSCLTTISLLFGSLHCYCIQWHVKETSGYLWKKTHTFPPQESKDITLFLCELADNSVAPRSQIKLDDSRTSIYACTSPPMYLWC